MLDDTIWPPKPDLPDPLTEYDDVIAAKPAALSETKTGPNRILLIKALRDEEGMELRQAFALSKSYSDRHSLLVTGKATKVFAWGGCGLAFSAVCLAFFNVYLLLFRREAVSHQPHHHAALIALDRQEMGVVAAMMLLIIISIIISASVRRISRRG